jgi:hypothetical protein
MWNEPSKEELAKIPTIYSTERTKAEDKVILLHFFIGGSDWYICEYSPDEELYFGFVILNGDLACAEWGYISHKELRDLKIGFVEVDRDLFWQPVRAGEVKEIVEAGGI